MACQRYAFYFECQGVRVAQNDVSAFLHLVKLNVAKIAIEGRRDEVRRLLTALLLARAIVLLAMRRANRVTTPEQWLMAQLDGACTWSHKTFSELCTYEAASLNDILVQVIKALATYEGDDRILALFDEAQTWMAALKEQFPPASGGKSNKDEMRPLLSAATHALRLMSNVRSMWMGTALSLRQLEKIQSVTGHDRKKYLFMEFSPLRADDVRRLLQQYIAWDKLDHKVQDLLTIELRGRARLAATFVAKLLGQDTSIKSDDIMKVLQEYREYMTGASTEYESLANNWRRLLTGQEIPAGSSSRTLDRRHNRDENSDQRTSSEMYDDDGGRHAGRLVLQKNAQIRVRDPRHVSRSDLTILESQIHR
jgi:hypothetical protein